MAHLLEDVVNTHSHLLRSAGDRGARYELPFTPVVASAIHTPPLCFQFVMVTLSTGDPPPGEAQWGRGLSTGVFSH